MRREHADSNLEPAGWRVRAWCDSAGVGRTTFFGLPPELKPDTVKIGNVLIIREAPGAWLQRVAEQQGKAAA